MARYSVNTTILVPMFYRFLAFVRYRDGHPLISFVDGITFLGREENYKSKVSELAHIELRYEEWKESWIGSGRILERTLHAIDRAGNLVNFNQKTKFKNIINPNHAKYSPDAERALYNVFKSKTANDEKNAFAQAIRVFGGNYDTIGFLFFAKDATRFLPVASRNFDKSFVSAGIDYHLEGQCSWDNYTGFIEIVRNVQEIMRDILPSIDVRLIDAHSFLWVINERVFREWEPDIDTAAKIETATEDYLSSSISGPAARKNRITSYITRSMQVAKATRDRANGICQLCGNPAPFMDKYGNPYLETHHIIWLSRGGKDSTDNTVALCPNCHTKMHVVDDTADVEILQRNAASRNRID